MSKFVAPELQIKLEQALKTAVEHVQQGVPDYETAVVKAAAEHNLNPAQTHRLCESFNRARAIYQYSQDGEKRAAPHQVVQPSAVLERMIATVPVGEKTAAYVNYSDYDRDPVEFQRLSKQAAPVPETPRAPAYGATVETEARRALSYIEQREHASKRAEDAARMVGTRCAGLLDDLAQKLAAAPMEQAVTTLAKLARLFNSKTASEFGPVTQLAARLPRHITRGVTREKLAAVSVPVRLSAAEQDMLGTLKAVESDTQEAQRYLDYARTEKQAAFEEKERLNLYFRVQPAEEAGYSAFFSKQAQAGGGSGGRGGGGSGTSKAPDPDRQQRVDRFERQQDEYDRLLERKKRESRWSPTDVFTEPNWWRDQVIQSVVPDVDKKHRRIQDEMDALTRSTLLEELMITDPILAEAPEADVLNAYEAVLQISPEIAGNKELTRSMLRQAIHADGISPYDALSLVDYSGRALKAERERRELSGRGPLPPETLAGRFMSQSGPSRDNDDDDISKPPSLPK